MSELSLRQPQIFQTDENYRSQPLIKDVLLDWANNLPGKSITVLDLASGFATDAFILNRQGINCFAQDLSLKMIDSGYNQGFVFVGAAEAIAFPDNRLSGAWLKDALLFICPEQRRQMFQELKRVLMPGGSLLLISEISHQYVARYRPAGLHATCDASISCPTLESFNFQLARLKRENARLQVFEFPCEPNEIRESAQKYGFNYGLISVYDKNEPLALENRWSDEAGFIVKLTKPA